MLTRMPIRRAVAAKGHTTRLTGAQVQPGPADFYALGAFSDLGLLDGLDCVEMRAAHNLVNGYLLSVIGAEDAKRI